MTTGTLETHPLTNLHEHPRNPRRGNPNRIADSIIQNGQYKPLVVNRGTHTGRHMEVLAGNHTLQALRSLGVGDTPCWVIDVDEETATRILLADNKTSDDSNYNTEALVEVLESLPALDGTGYSDAELAALLVELGDDQEPEEPAAPATDDGFITIRLRVPEHLAAQWLNHTAGFDTPEEALEYLLDHSA